jgi:23S rRNA (guanosine2251-2'-O)-methyltransferase
MNRKRSHDNRSKDRGRVPQRQEGRGERRSHGDVSGAQRHEARAVSGAEFVMGRNCAAELVKRSPERIIEVVLADSGTDGGGRFDEELLKSLQAYPRVAVRRVGRKELDGIVGSESHQGVVVRVKPRIFATLEDLIASATTSPTARIVALDGVQDPHNLGAILRAAECFGATGVVWSKNRTAPLTPVVTKVSVGASELLPLCPVANLHQALERLKKEGLWTVGAMVAPDAQPLDTFEVPDRCVVVVGAEGEGIHKVIEKSLDYKVYIPMSGQIDSLNVSQATAVILSRVASQHRQKELVKVA